MKRLAGPMAAGIMAAALAAYGYAHRAPMHRNTPQAAQQTGPDKPAKPVLVELFTSEGCSSCPPADALLAKLARADAVRGARIIALSEHVDYWDHLGWKDPFSGARYTARQQAYSRLLRLSQVYTPQMVVDGRKELLGSNESAARAAIAAAVQNVEGKTSTSLKCSQSNPGSLSVTINVDPIRQPVDGEQADILLAVTEDKLTSSVTRGENAGRELPHTAVVRDLKLVGHANSRDKSTVETRCELRPDWKSANLKLVAFVQGHDSGTIYSIATSGINESVVLSTN